MRMGTYIAGQTFILFHETFILLVHLQHLADAVCCSFGLVIEIKPTLIPIHSVKKELVSKQIFQTKWGHIQKNTIQERITMQKKQSIQNEVLVQFPVSICNSSRST